MPKAWGGCSLVLQSYDSYGTKEQPPAHFVRRPPSQEGSFIHTILQPYLFFPESDSSIAPATTRPFLHQIP